MNNKEIIISSLEDGTLADIVKEYYLKDNPTINNPTDVYNLIYPLSEIDPSKEIVWGLFISSRNELIKLEEVGNGTINRASFYPREVVKKIISYGASSLIIAHNHPSGSLEFSREDILCANVMKAACSLVQCVFHDSIIVSKEGYTSLKEEDHLWQNEYVWELEYWINRYLKPAC